MRRHFYTLMYNIRRMWVSLTALHLINNRGPFPQKLLSPNLLCFFYLFVKGILLYLSVSSSLLSVLLHNSFITWWSGFVHCEENLRYRTSVLHPCTHSVFTVHHFGWKVQGFFKVYTFKVYTLNKPQIIFINFEIHNIVLSSKVSLLT